MFLLIKKVILIYLVKEFEISVKKSLRLQNAFIFLIENL